MWKSSNIGSKFGQGIIYFMWFDGYNDNYRIPANHTQSFYNLNLLICL